MRLKALVVINIRKTHNQNSAKQGQLIVGQEIIVHDALVDEAGYLWQQIVDSGFWVAYSTAGENPDIHFKLIPDPPPLSEDGIILFNELLGVDSVGGFWQMAEGGYPLPDGRVLFEVHIIQRNKASALSVVLYCEGDDITQVRLIPGAMLVMGQG